MATEKQEKIIVENVNVPGHTTRVDASKYRAMKKAMLKVLPKCSPGLSHAELRTAILPKLDENLFPDGKKSGWWSKTVQLDLEAKGIITREASKPLRWYRVK